MLMLLSIYGYENRQETGVCFCHQYLYDGNVMPFMGSLYGSKRGCTLQKTDLSIFIDQYF